MVKEANLDKTLIETTSILECAPKVVFYLKKCFKRGGNEGHLIFLKNNTQKWLENFACAFFNYNF